MALGPLSFLWCFFIVPTCCMQFNGTASMQFNYTESLEFKEIHSRFSNQTPFLTLYNLAVNNCVYECQIRPDCEAVNFWRTRKQCDLLTNDMSDLSRPSAGRPCVYVRKSDVRESLDWNLSSICPSCNWKETCDVETSQCVIRECRFPTISNGEVLGSMQTVGSKVVFTCTGNYTLVPPVNQSVCLANGRWSHEPTCNNDCGEPTVVTGANVSSGGSLPGDVRYYTCHTGYTSTDGANMTVTCQSDNMWSPIQFQCLRNCSQPLTVGNATVLPGETVQGSIRTYKCDTGFSVTENTPVMTVTCQANGSWTAVGFTCVKDCTTPPNVSHTTVVEPGDVKQGSIRNYICDTGYSTLDTPTSITCQTDATWSAVQFTCHPDCPVPPPVANANVVYSGQLNYGSVLTYTCNSGYSKSDNSMSITCESNATWSDVLFECLQDCLTPSTVANANLDNSEEVKQGSVRTYTCDSGYTRSVTDTTITCQSNATWSDVQFTCLEDCPSPPDVANADVYDGQKSQGSVRFYYCDDGYSRSGTSTSITCQSDVTWSDVLFTCLRVCPTPPEVNGAYVVTGDRSQGSVRTYKCKSGYSLSDTSTSMSITCQSDATWTVKQFTCLKDCPPPPLIANGYVLFGNTILGSSRTYECGSIYEPVGDPVITCEWRKDTAEWTELSFKCSAHCGPPLNVTNAEVSDGGELQGDERTYTCNDGYGVLPGTSKEVTCQASGDWSTVGFECILKSCVADWHQIGESCYYVGNDASLDFDNARWYCVSMAGYIIKLETSTENDNLKTWIQDNYGPISWWVGLRYSGSDNVHKWYGTSEELGYIDGWQTGEPQSPSSGDNAVQFENNGWRGISDSGGSNTFIPVCERRLEVIV